MKLGLNISCLLLIYKMDLTQRKLDKSEWESIEVPSTDNEKEILQLMILIFFI